MHRLVTNISAITLDVYRFNFEPAGALEIINEHSGPATARLPYIYFADLKQACLWSKSTT